MGVLELRVLEVAALTAAWAVVCDVAATVNAIAADSSHGNRNAPCRNLAYAAPWWLDVINRAPPVTDAVLARLNTDVSGLCDTPAHRRHLFGGTHETRLRQLRKVSERANLCSTAPTSSTQGCADMTAPHPDPRSDYSQRLAHVRGPLATRAAGRGPRQTGFSRAVRGIRGLTMVDAYTDTIQAQNREPADDLRGQARRRALKMQPTEWQDFLDRAAKATSLEGLDWEIAIECWLGLAEQREDDWTFAQGVADWIRNQAQVDKGMAVRLANRIAWKTAGEPFTPSKAQLAELSAGSAADLFILTLYADRPRFLFNFKSLYKLLDNLPENAAKWPLSKAYRGMQLLSHEAISKRYEGRNYINEAWKEAKDSSPGEEQAVLDVSLHAFDAALNPEDFADDMLAIGGDVLYADRPPVVFYRLARANGRKANKLRITDRYEARECRENALEQIRDALRLLSGDNDFSRFFGEQVRQEREVLLVNQSMDEHFYRLSEAEAELKKTEAHIREEARTNSVRSTEVLALFSSAVAFAVGAAAIGSNAKSPWISVATGVLLAAGLLGFCTLILLASRFTTGSTLRAEGPLAEDPVRGTGRWVWQVLVLISLLLSIMALVCALLVAPRIMS